MVRRITAATLAVGLAIAACSPAGGARSTGSDGAATATGTASVAPSAASATGRPTPTSLPTAIPRPTDLPTDGSCDPDHTCLGLLDEGEHREDVFIPHFSFTTTDGWANLQHSGGSVDLHWLQHPGDAIYFFARPRASSTDGTLANIGKTTVQSLGAWIAANPDLQSTAPEPVTVGGLAGQRMDISLAPTADQPAGECPTPTCIGFLSGTDRATWAWDLGVANSEKVRLYLLDAGDDVIAIAADSLDGTTFEALTAEADQLLGSVTFDQ
jgi:hypothetical protein